MDDKEIIEEIESDIAKLKEDLDETLTRDEAERDKVEIIREIMEESDRRYASRETPLFYDLDDYDKSLREIMK